MGKRPYFEVIDFVATTTQDGGDRGVSIRVDRVNPTGDVQGWLEFNFPDRKTAREWADRKCAAYVSRHWVDGVARIKYYDR